MLRSKNCLVTAACLVALSLFAGSARAADDDAESPYYEGFYQNTVMFLTQANLSIGILGDASTKGVYEKETAAKIAGVHAVFAQETAKSLNKMAKGDDIEEADAESMKRMAKCCGLIQKQADALIALLGGDETQGAEFQKNREATAKLLEEIRKEMDEFFKK